MEIRKLSQTDQPKLGTFIENLSPKTMYNWGRYPSETTYEINNDIYASEIDGRMNWVVENGDNIIAYGYLCFFKKTTKRYNCSLGLVISDQTQETGVGTYLLEHLITEARDMGMKKVWLHVFQDNVRALKLYANNGFVVEGLFINEEDWFDDTPRNVISMAKYLGRI